MPPTPRQCVSLLTALVVFAASVCCTCAATGPASPHPQQVVSAVKPEAQPEARHACCNRESPASAHRAESDPRPTSDGSRCPHCARPELSTAPAFHKLTAGSVDLLTQPSIPLSLALVPQPNAPRPTLLDAPPFHPPTTLLSLHCALTT